MMKVKISYLYVLVPALILLLAAFFIQSFKQRTTPQRATTELLPVEVHAIQLAAGWGYDVTVDNKIFIHQDCIPAVTSYKTFATAADALKVGQRVLDKLKSGQPPSVTPEEINSLSIQY